MKLLTMIKWLIGFLALSLGAIGVVIPVLPTTPFVLLAIGCFSTTPVIQKKILKIKIFKEYYESYTEKKQIPVRTVIISLCFLWAMLLLSICAVQGWGIRILLFLVGILVTVHILVISRIKRRNGR